MAARLEGRDISHASESWQLAHAALYTLAQKTARYFLQTSRKHALDMETRSLNLEKEVEFLKDLWAKGQQSTCLQLPCPAGGSSLPRAVMVQWVPVLDAEVPATAITGQLHHLPLSTASTLALIGEDLRVGPGSRSHQLRCGASSLRPTRQSYGGNPASSVSITLRFC